MSDWFAFAVTATVTMSLMMHVGVIALQTTVLVIESFDAGGLARRFFYPALVQNVAIVTALFGFSLGDLNLAVVGALLLALSAVIASGRPHPTYRAIELPLLVSSILSLCGIALIRALA